MKGKIALYVIGGLFLASAALKIILNDFDFAAIFQLIVGLVLVLAGFGRKPKGREQ